MEYSTFLLPHLRVQRCTLVHNYLFSSCAPVFQTAMFCHGIASSLGCVCGGVGIIIHKATPHAEKLQGINQKKGESKSISTALCISQYRGAAPFGEFNGAKDAKYSPTGVSLQPAFTGDFNISVVIQLNGITGISGIEKELHRRRLSGGIIKKHGQIEPCESISDAYSKVQTGYLLVDRSYLLEGGEVITRYFDVLSEKLLSGRIRTPAGLGYSFLTNPAANVSGSRDGHDHVYAESVSGIVEYVPIRKATDKEKSNLWITSYIADSVLVVKQFFHEE